MWKKNAHTPLQTSSYIVICMKAFTLYKIQLPPSFSLAYSHTDMYMCLHVHTSIHTCTLLNLHTGKLLSKHNFVFFLFKRGQIDVLLQSFFVKNKTKTQRQCLSFYLCVNISWTEDVMVTELLKNQENKGMCSISDVKLEKQELINYILFNEIFPPMLRLVWA